MIAWQNVFMTRAPLYNSAGIRLGAWEARQVVGKAMVMCGLVVKPTVQRTKWGYDSKQNKKHRKSQSA